MTFTRNFIISLVMILIWAAVLLFFAIRFYQKQLSKKNEQLHICSRKRKAEGTILACRLFLFQFISLNPAIYPKNKGTI